MGPYLSQGWASLVPKLGNYLENYREVNKMRAGLFHSLAISITRCHSFRANVAIGSHGLWSDCGHQSRSPNLGTSPDP